MVADLEIRKAIEIIDQKIFALYEARNRLETAFGVPNDETVRGIFAKSYVRLLRSDENSRKAKLARFLSENGPMTRAEIVTNLGFPEGTISYCLNDKSMFKKLHDGRWGLESAGDQAR